MFNVFRTNISGATLFQLAAELSWLFAAVLLILQLEGMHAAEQSDVAALAFVFAAMIIGLNGAFGLYRTKPAHFPPADMCCG